MSPSPAPEACFPETERGLFSCSNPVLSAVLRHGLLGRVLQDELQAEQVGEPDQALQRQGRRASFQRGQPTLTDVQLSGYLLLMKPACFAPAADEFGDLTWVCHD
jgi:hypothetical protein